MYVKLPSYFCFNLYEKNKCNYNRSLQIQMPCEFHIQVYFDLDKKLFLPLLDNWKHMDVPSLQDGWSKLVLFIYFYFKQY